MTEETELIRTPPYNADAEQALLGAVLLNNSAYTRNSEFLRPEHFGNAVHARIYAAIGRLVDRGQIANPVTLKNLFDEGGALADVGGAQYLARLAGAAVTVVNAGDYARHIYDLYLRRQLITLGEDIVNDAFRQDLDDVAAKQIERAQARLLDLATCVGREDARRKRYHEYLLSPEWMALRRKVLDRCGGLCEGCREERVTQVHHLTYAHVRNELLFELVGLCDACHERAHRR
jgi:replicative DNA helicase